MSSSDLAIQVENVSMQFEMYARPSDQLKQYLLPRLRRRLRMQPRQYFQPFVALDNISFNVKKGESVGIIGRNGSGKSTLLQIITGTLSPTSGQVRTQGRIAAMLELGSGFNPEFSGRENVYLNGALLGLSRAQIDARFDAIAAFADIGSHLDQPVKTYSSGMLVRIAFAVATSFDPDILIIDEALAVGDAYFQQKCFHRLEKFKERGGTMLFVSHDANAVKQLCDKALLINQGSAISYGTPRDVVDLYQGLTAQRADMSDQEIVVTQASSEATGWQKATTITTNHDAELIDFKLLDTNSQPVLYIESETQLTVQYRVKLHKNFERPAFGVIIRDRVGRSIFETSTYAMRMPETSIASGSLVTIRFIFNLNLKAGQYSFSVGVANKGFSRSEFEEYSLLMHDVEQVQVVDSSTAIFYGGIFNMHPTVSIDILGVSHE